MAYPTRLGLSTLLLLCIGTGRATWIDSVAVIDAVSEPEPYKLFIHYKISSRLYILHTSDV